MPNLSKFIQKYFIYYPVFFLKGHNLPYHIKEYRKSQYFSKETLSIMQINKLNKIVKYSIKHVPFYVQEYNDIDVCSFTTIADLNRLPFITKKDIKERPQDFQTTEKLFFITKKTTGGSTGQPVTVSKSLKSLTCELAATWRAYSWVGICIGDRQGKYWGVPFSYKDKFRAKIIDIISNRKRFSAFSFNEKNLKDYYCEIMKYKPDYLYGYVSMLTEFAQYIKRNDLKPKLSLKCIITTSEVLTPYHRNLLEEVFSTRVYNEYGCGEVGSIAHECEFGSMHVMAENLIVEICDGNRICKPGEVGEVVVTELNNYAMPLIRYRLGDFASFAKENCGCGRSLPVIKNIHGRAYDIITNSTGEKFHGEFFMYILEEAQRKNMGVSAFQVIQKSIDHLRVNIKPDIGYRKETEEFIANQIRNKFDSKVTINFALVKEIDREPSGKVRLIVGMERSD